MVKAIERLLDDLLDRPQYLDKKQLLRMLLEKLKVIPDFRLSIFEDQNSNLGALLGKDLLDFSKEIDFAPTCF